MCARGRQECAGVCGRSRARCKSCAAENARVGPAGDARARDWYAHGAGRRRARRARGWGWATGGGRRHTRTGLDRADLARGAHLCPPHSVREAGAPLSVDALLLTPHVGLLPLALYGPGSYRAERGWDLHTASPGLSSACVRHSRFWSKRELLDKRTKGKSLE